MNKALAAEAAATPAAPRPPRAAATIVVVRDGAQGLEVLLSRRAEVGDLNSGAWVFPGGVLDAADRDAHASCIGLDDAAASARLGLPHGGLDHYITARRSPAAWHNSLMWRSPRCNGPRHAAQAFPAGPDRSTSAPDVSTANNRPASSKHSRTAAM